MFNSLCIIRNNGNSTWTTDSIACAQKNTQMREKVAQNIHFAQPAKGLVEGMKNRLPKYAAVRGRLFIVLLL